MLASTARRLALRSGRPFSSAAMVQDKIPTLGDFTHTAESSAIFKQKVLSFREELAEKARAPPKVSFTSEEPHEKTGVVKSLLYGSAKGQREEAEMEKSYSQVLARGKYVHAIEFHHVKPDKHAEYVKFIGETYQAIAGDKENKCHLVGSWKTEVGDLDTFVHIWEYQGYAGYHHTLNRISNLPLNQHLQQKLPPMLNGRRTDLMQEFSFWPTSPPRAFGGIFELRSYTLNPGNLLEWETHWRAGLKARRNVMEGVGAWFTQVGELNRVHYLWQFNDLRARQVGREQSWGEKGWSGTVHKTVPLIQKMESRILVSMPWSPVS
ncbi:hypothetical protein EDC01DRAFT_634238 [Geopyxis carbonaria]|nr:hypothetical protein EDC01DRAFT_634238 [Geopyxis carbonaria]